MRTFRAFGIAAAIVVALPTFASAQHGRPFKNAWFWGVKAGGMTLADSAQSSTVAPMAGVDWMITRTHGGLYVSGGAAFFNEKTLAVRDPNFPVDSGVRTIALKNMRRLDFAAMGFPSLSDHVHPYVGVGFSFAEISNATATGTFSTTDQMTYAQELVHDYKVRAAPFGIVGAQWNLVWASAFAQLTASPNPKDFLLYNGQPLSATLEFGIRYNVGSSIDKD